MTADQGIAKRKFRLRWLAWGALALLAVLFLIVAVAIHIVTGDQFVGRTVGSKLGREFSIEGPLKIDWDWKAPAIHARQIRLANAVEFKDPYMVDMAALDMRIELLPLLTGKLVIPELVLTKPQLVLEKDDKVKNWQFPLLSKGKAVTDAALPQNRHEFPVIGRLVIKDGVMVYRDTPAGLDIELKLTTVTGGSGEEDSTIEIDGKGTMQGQPFTLVATGGSIQTLRENSKPFPLDLDLKMGATHVVFKGTMLDPVKLKGIDARMELSGNSMSDLFYLTSIPLPPTPPYDIEGQLKKEGEIWAYNGFTGLVGDSDLSGSLTYDTSGERGYMKADLLSRKMDVDDLGGFIGLAPSAGKGETAAPDQKARAPREKADSRLLPDVPLNLDRLRATDMDVDLKIEKLAAPSLPFKGMDVHFDLKQGLLKLDPMQLTLADGSVAGALILDGREQTPHVDMNLTLRNLQLGRFFDGTRFARTTKGAFGGRIVLKGDGLSLAGVMARSNGRISVIIADGTISMLLIEASDIDIAEAAPLFLGEDRATRIRCGIGDFKVTDGVLHSDVFVLDTVDTNLQGKVDINLKSETIDGELDAKSKDGSLLAIQSPITVNGRLKSPTIGLGVAETGTRGGIAAALGALLGPLAAIIPFIETGDEGKNADCRALIARAGGK